MGFLFLFIHMTIKLKSLIKEVFDRSWTKSEAEPIAQKIGGRVVGSVAKLGRSANDLDIRVEEYNATNVERVMAELGFECSGSMVVSPAEVRRTKKDFGQGWQRAHVFIHPNGKKIDVWHDDHD